MIFGLDIAKRTGIASYNHKTDEVFVTTFAGSPIELLGCVKSLLPLPEFVEKVVIEKHVHFRNANTTRALLERLGYVKWSLQNFGYETVDLFPGRGRKFLTARYAYLGFDKDELDAITLLNAYLQREEPFEIEQIRRFKDAECWLQST